VSADYGVSFGVSNSVCGVGAIAISEGSVAGGRVAISTGNVTCANGNYSITFGQNTMASCAYSMVAGCQATLGAIVAVYEGAPTEESYAFHMVNETGITVQFTKDGTAFFCDSVQISNADYAEYFEPCETYIPFYRFVTFSATEPSKVQLYNPDNPRPVIGITSSNPAIIGDAALAKVGVPVGMFGKLVVDAVDIYNIHPGDYVIPHVDGKAILSNTSGYYVLRVFDHNRVEVLLK